VTVPKLMHALREAGLDNVSVVGGIVADNEEALLLGAGVREVFQPGSTMDEITGRIRIYVHAARLHAGRCGALRHRLETDHRHFKPERLHFALRRQPHVLLAVAAGC
jgi:hypothetical protein